MRGEGRSPDGMRCALPICRRARSADKKETGKCRKIDEEAERASKERLAGVLMFPTAALQFANVEPQSKKGNVVEMPSSAQIEVRRSLRTVPA